MRLLFSLIAALALVCPVSSTELNVFNPRFKTPYVGKKANALLDIDVQTGNTCVQGIQLQIKVPLTSDSSGNAHFTGEPFSNVPITGFSTWADPNTATVSASWDGTVLTLSNLAPATGAGAYDRSTDHWMNVNLNIPIPLTLTLNDDVASSHATPYLNINDPSVFIATGIPCETEETNKSVTPKLRKIANMKQQQQ